MRLEYKTDTFLAVVVVIVLVLFPLASYAVDIDQIWPQFPKYEKELRSKFMDNKKIRTHSKQYEHPKWKSVLAAEVSITTISSPRRVRTDISVLRVKESKQTVRAMIYDGDELYYLTAPEKRFAIEAHHYETGAANNVANFWLQPHGHNVIQREIRHQTPV